MLLWHFLHTTNVLRRRAAIVCIHRGFSRCPLTFRSASLRTWCTCTSRCEPHSSHLSAKSRLISSLRSGHLVLIGFRSLSIAFCRRRSGIPPKYAVSGGLPSPRSTVTLRHLYLPSGSSRVCLYFLAIVATLVLCLWASVFSSDACMVQRSFDS